jgi:hypothetical protein
MPYFYYDADGQKQGPISGSYLQQLASQGTITPQTIIENEQGRSAKAERVRGLVFPQPIPPVEEEKVIFRGHPAWILGHPFRFCGYIFLIVIGFKTASGNYWADMMIGWGILDLDIFGIETLKQLSAALAYMMIGWGVFGIVRLWFDALCTTLTITNKRSIYRRGFFYRGLMELFHEDIRGASVRQRFLERILLIGTVSISSSAHGNDTINARGFFRPDRIKNIIQRYRRR